MKHVRPTPLGALARGLVAGALGSAVQNLFFKLRPAPAVPRGAFSPPEQAQLEEREAETITRRFVESMMMRPLSEEGKKAGAAIVHYAFGALWGGLYGLARETIPGAKTPASGLVFGSAVWILGDQIVVPAFRLAGGPSDYPLKTHAYGLAAHLVYGASVWAAYEMLRPRSLALAGAALWALEKDIAVERYLPRPARPLVRTVISSAAKLRAQRPIVRAAEVVRSP